MWVDTATTKSPALDLDKYSLSPSHTIWTFSTVGWPFQSDLARQDEFCAASFPFLNHIQTNTDTLWGSATVLVSLALDLDDCFPSPLAAPPAHVQQLGGDVRPMWCCCVNMNSVQNSYLVSIITKQSLIQFELRNSDTKKSCLGLGPRQVLS